MLRLIIDEGWTTGYNVYVKDSKGVTEGERKKKRCAGRETPPFIDDQ